MIQSTIKARFGTLLAKNSGSVLVANFTLIGTLLEPARLLKIINTTDQNIYISTNGVDNHDFIPAGSFALYDMATNKTESGGNFEFPSGTKFYAQAQAADATSGYVTITYIYGATS